MSKQVAALVLGCILGVMSCGKTTPLADKLEPRQKEETWKNYFPLAVGNEWHYWDGVQSAASRVQKKTRRVTGTATVRNAQCYVVETITEGELTTRETLALVENGVVAYKQEGKTPAFDFEPPQQRLRFPLMAGAAWTWEGKMPGVEDATIKYEVESQESVKLPAGDFNAVKIKATVYETSQLKAAESMRFGTINVEVEPVCMQTLWLAPGVGIVKETFKVKHVFVTSELASYQLGEKKSAASATREETQPRETGTPKGPQEKTTQRETNNKQAGTPLGIDGRPFSPPPGWPKDVAIYPGLTVFQLIPPSGMSRVIMLNAITKDPATKVAAFYAKEAAKYGWEKMQDGGGYHGKGGTLTVAFTSGADGGTDVAIMTNAE